MDEQKHLHFREMIQANTDGRLDAGQQAGLEAHLAACAECRAYAGQIDMLQERLGAVLHSRWDRQVQPVNRPLTAYSRLTRRKVMLRQIVNTAGAAVFFILLLAATIFIFERFVPPLKQPAPGGGATENSLPGLTGTPEPGLAPETALTLTATPAGMVEANTTTMTPEHQPYAWLPGGKIVFQLGADGTNSEIYRMDVDGGGLTNLSDNPAQDYAPVWSPDGQKIAFISDRDGQPEAFVQNQDGTGLVKLPAPGFTIAKFGSALAWSPDGVHLAASMVLSGTVNGMTQVLILLSTDGSAAVQLTDGNDAFPNWSADGQWIAFTRFYSSIQTEIHQVFIIRPDKSGLRQLTFAPDEVSNAAAWSPGNRKLAYFSAQTLGENKLYARIKTVDIDSSETAVLADLGEVSYALSQDGLAWSPDGLRLAYIFPGSQQQVYLINADGSGAVALAGSFERIASLSWSPDGSWLAYTAMTGTDLTVYIANATDASAAPTALKHHGQSLDPQWQPRLPKDMALPEGQMVFMDLNENGAWDIYSANLDGTNRSRVTGVPTGQGQFLPAVSPNGQMVVYSSNAGNQDGIWDLILAGSEGLHTLLKGEAGGEWLVQPGAWSPDGQRLAVIRNVIGNENAVVNQELYMVSAVNDTAVKIREGFLHNVQWSPDGSRIAFMTGVKAQGDNLVVINPDGSGEKVVVQGITWSETDQVYTWAPDGQAIAFINSSFTPESKPGDSGRYELKEANLDNGEVKLLALLVECPGNTRYWFGSLAWQPGSQRLAFISNHLGGNGLNGLYLVDTADTAANVTLLTVLPDTPLIETQASVETGTATVEPPQAYPKNRWDWGWHAAWTADGRWLFFSSGALSGEASIYALDVPNFLLAPQSGPLKVTAGTHVDLGR